MKTQLQLGIPKPCNEKFENFAPRPEGGYCSSCQTTVVDFSTLSDTEIRDFFAQSTEKVCGRFKSSQLKTYQVHRKPVSNYWGLRAAVLTIPLLSVIPFTEAQAQSVVPSQNIEQGLNVESIDAQSPKNKSLEGKVIDATTGELVPFANIIVRNPTRGTISNLDGSFKLDQVNLGDTLEVTFVGYTKKTVVIESFDSMIIKLQESSCEMGEVVFITGEVESTEIYQRKRSFIDRIKNFLFE